MLAEGLRAVIHDHEPMEAAVEETFVNINPKSTLAARAGARRGAGDAGERAAEGGGVRGEEGEAGGRRRGLGGQDAGRLHGASPAAEGGRGIGDAADALAVAICGAHHRPIPLQRLKA